jgi:TonB family protein
MNTALKTWFLGLLISTLGHALFLFALVGISMPVTHKPSFQKKLLSMLILKSPVKGNVDSGGESDNASQESEFPDAATQPEAEAKEGSPKTISENTALKPRRSKDMPSRHKTRSDSSTMISSALFKQMDSVLSVENPSPFYPAESREKKEEGLVLLDVEIEWPSHIPLGFKKLPDTCRWKNKLAKKVELVKSSGHKNLDAAALASVSKWRFPIPECKEMLVVQRQGLKLPIRFRLKN